MNAKWVLRGVWALVLCGSVAALGARSAAAEVVNGSFEDPALETDGAFSQAPIPGWTAAGGSVGVWRLPHPTYFMADAPDGSQIGYSNGSSIAQQLTDVLAPGLQVASLMAARRDNQFAGSFRFELWAGGTVAGGVVSEGTLLDSAEFDHTLHPASSFHPLVLSYDAAGDDPLLGEPLALSLVRTGGAQMNFDRVTLPEPSGLTAAALPVLLLGALARKRAATAPAVRMAMP